MHRFLRAPTWLIGLIFGVPFEVAITVMVKQSGDTLTGALSFGAAAGALVGLAIALGSRKPRRQQRQVLDQLPVADWKVARAATWRGPAPTRPEIRSAAVGLIELRLRNLRRARTWMTILYALNLVIAGLNIAAGNWQGIVLAAMWIVGLFDQWHAPRRLRRRHELLAAT